MSPSTCLLPGRSLKRDGVPGRTLAAGAVLGIAGFFVVPVLGLPLGFVAGVWLAEATRLGSAAQAGPSTRRALIAVGWSILIELGAGLLAAAVWVAGLVITAR